MITRSLIVMAFVVATAVFTWWWQRREGRFTEANGVFDRADLGLQRRERPGAVLVEFFGEHCAPCVTVGNRIEKIAAAVPDVHVVSIDAGARLDLADRYEVRRVPTVFVADQDLRIIWRASGVPSEQAIMQALLGPDWAGRPHPEHEDPLVKSEQRAARS
ncbi:MAG TPA: thioredoxin family protein [Actinomycetota bacterium]